jgi:hypothetical protein
MSMYDASPISGKPTSWSCSIVTVALLYGACPCSPIANLAACTCHTTQVSVVGIPLQTAFVW